MKKVFLIILLLTALSYSQTIKMQGGRVYKDVTILEVDDRYITFQYAGNKIMVRKDQVTYDEIAGMEISRLNKSDPCNDPVLRALTQKDSLTSDEMRMYVDLKKLCADNESNLARLKQSETLTNSVSSYLAATVIISILAIAATLALLL